MLKVRRGGDENVVRYAAPEEEEELDLEENRPVSEVASQLDMLEGELDECRHELENLMRQHYNPPSRSWNTCLSG